MFESIDWIFEIYLLKILDETDILSQLFSPWDGSVHPVPWDYFSAAKMHQILSSTESLGADTYHQLSCGVAIMLAYEISLSCDDSSRKR